MPRGNGWLLGCGRRFKVCDVGRDDLGLPFLNRGQERLYLKEDVEWSKGRTYELESGENFFTDAVLVKIRLHGLDDVVDNSAIYGGLKGSIRVTRPSFT